MGRNGLAMFSTSRNVGKCSLLQQASLNHLGKTQQGKQNMRPWHLEMMR
jgi:hypothetical protein